MYYVVAFILGMFLFAVILDHLLKEEAAAAWKKASGEWWSNLDKESLHQIIVSANRWFLGLFDAVYGERVFSWKRTYRSILSSYLALLILTWLLWTTMDPVYRDSVFFATMLFAAIFYNLIPDYLSLQETRLIMQLSQDRPVGGIAILAVLDLFLSAAIFLGFLALLMAVFGPADETPLELLWKFLIEERTPVIVLFLSTFFTSFLWFAFLASIVAIRVLQRISPFLRILLGVIARSESPARTSAGFLFIGTALLYGAYRLASYLV